jgi:hypothetical protein
MRRSWLLACAVAVMCGCASPERDLAKAKTENTPAAFFEVINRHPNSPQAKEAAAEAWKLTIRDDSARAYQEYLKAAPKAEHTEDASQALKETVVIPFLAFTGRRYGSEGGKLSAASLANAQKMLNSPNGGYSDFIIQGTIGGISMNGRDISLEKHTFQGNIISTLKFGRLKCLFTGSSNIMETGMTLICGGTRQQRDDLLEYLNGVPTVR